MKQFLSIILALALMLSLCSVVVFAEEVDLAEEGSIISGTTGGANYSLDDRGSNRGYRLSVTNGSGYDTDDYWGYVNGSWGPTCNAPWTPYANKITQINFTGIHTIGLGFYDCPSSFTGRNINLDDTGLKVTIDSRLQRVDKYAFYNAHITDLDVERLSYHYADCEDYSFAYNDFTTLNVPGFYSIGRYAFYNCKKLTSVRFDGVVAEIHDYAFYGCNNINYVYWPGTRASFIANVHATGNSALLNAETIEFGTKTPIGITSDVRITVTEPVAGVRPDYKAYLSSYYCELNPDSSGKAMTIWNKTDGNLQNTDKFAVGKAYTYTVYLKGKTGKDNEGYDAQYYFTDQTPIYINGNLADKVQIGGNGEWARAEYTFAAKVVTFVDAVNATLTAPRAGAHPNFTATKDNNNCDFYTGMGLLCPHGTGLEFIDHSKGAPSNVISDVGCYMTDEDTFKSGQKYTARVFLSTTGRTETYFGPDLIAKINGNTAVLGSDPSDGKQTLMWFDYTFTAGSGGCLMGDVTGDGKVDNTDAVTLKRYVMGWAGYASKIKVMAAADLDGSGGVNNTDAVILKRCVMDWSGYKAKYIVWK